MMQGEWNLVLHFKLIWEITLKSSMFSLVLVLDSLEPCFTLRLKELQMVSPRNRLKYTPRGQGCDCGRLMSMARFLLR